MSHVLDTTLLIQSFSIFLLQNLLSIFMSYHRDWRDPEFRKISEIYRKISEWLLKRQRDPLPVICVFSASLWWISHFCSIRWRNLGFLMIFWWNFYFFTIFWRYLLLFNNLLTKFVVFSQSFNKICIFSTILWQYWRGIFVMIPMAKFVAKFAILCNPLMKFAFD